jgi:hypothetical protein
MQPRTDMMAARLWPALGLVACASSPALPHHDPSPLGRDPHADTIVTFTEKGQTRRCPGVDPSVFRCGMNQPEPDLGACPAAAVLGAPDQRTFSLEPKEVLEVALLCSSIVEHGGADSSEFRIWAEVPDGASAVVEVSQEGSYYQAIGKLTRSDQSFDLARSGLDLVQFVRLARAEGAALAIDAIEAFPLDDSGSAVGAEKGSEHDAVAGQRQENLP